MAEATVQQQIDLDPETTLPREVQDRQTREARLRNAGIRPPRATQPRTDRVTVEPRPKVVAWILRILPRLS